MLPVALIKKIKNNQWQIELLSFARTKNLKPYYSGFNSYKNTYAQDSEARQVHLHYNLEHYDGENKTSNRRQDK
jgi:hypothetical protein